MTIDRRSFLRIGAGMALGTLEMARPGRASSWTVGVGQDASAYAATVRAINACGEWPPTDLAGRIVVIKPNLVVPLPAETGTTTDPEVVRAVVDLALADGAAAVLIVETSPIGAHFDPCGYGFFRSYDPLGRVRLVDLNALPLILAPIPGGLAYPAMYVPDLLLRNDIVFVSVGKLKVHVETLVSLSTKNLFGLPGVGNYLSPSMPTGRFAAHDRGISQAIVDINRLRPVHFAVIDGMWGMEGVGPVFGTPVQLGMVLAGRNSVAVDRVALSATGLPPPAARHLVYASRLGLGPANIDQVTVVGDPLVTHAFSLSSLSPVLEYPHLSPVAFDPQLGQETTARIWYAETCVRKVDVLRLYDDTPAVDQIRTLAEYSYKGAGNEVLSWDGRDQDGLAVPPGRYAIHVRVLSISAKVRPADAVGWVTIRG